MMNLFQIAPNDQSLYYLSQIFGVVGTLLPAKDPTMILGVMFRVFNTAMLTVGGFIVIYTIVVGLLKTAQEGEFLGRNWNSLWVPLRTVGGIVCLFPTDAGYSIIQVIFMWIVVQGIGAADQLWTTAIKYTSVVGGVSSSVTTPDTIATRGNIKKLFQSLVCQASAKATYGSLQNSSIPDGSSLLRWYCGDPANINANFCRLNNQAMYQISPRSQSNYEMGPDITDTGKRGSCGVLSLGGACNPGLCKSKTANVIPNSTTDCLEYRLCQVQRKNLQNIVNVFGKIAEQFVMYDYQFAQYFDASKILCSFNICRPLFNPPQWVESYCSDRQYTRNCCVAVTTGTTSCAMKPSSVGSIVAGTDTSPKNPAELSDQAVKNIMNDFAMKRYLGEDNLDFVGAATTEYVSAMMAAVTKFQADKIALTPKQSLESWQQVAMDSGWIQAGSFVFKMAEVEKGEASVLSKYMDVNIKTSSDNTSQLLSTYRSNFDAAGKLIDAIKTQQESKNPSPSYGGVANVPQLSPIMDGLRSASGTLLHTFMANLAGESGNLGGPADVNQAGKAMMSGKKHPLKSLASFGYSMMMLAQSLFVLTIGVVIAIGVTLSFSSFMVWGTGVAAGWTWFIGLVMILAPFFLLLIGSLYSLGALLGIYVPLIPYIIFVVGGLGWLLAVIEAIVAAPIVALGILMPTGHHEIMGKAEASLMLILSLFLRPSLMVIGLIIGLLLAIVGLNLLNSGFLYIVTSIISAPGIFEIILFIAVYVSIVVTVMNKVFSPIYALPNQVLTWIGGHGQQFGDAGEALSGAKGAAEQSAGQLGKTGQATGSGLMGLKNKEETEAAGLKINPKLLNNKDGGGSGGAAGGGGGSP